MYHTDISIENKLLGAYECDTLCTFNRCKSYWNETVGKSSRVPSDTLPQIT